MSLPEKSVSLFDNIFVYFLFLGYRSILSYFQHCCISLKKMSHEILETVSIAEPLQNRQHARLMLSTLEHKGKREG